LESAIVWSLKSRFDLKQLHGPFQNTAKLCDRHANGRINFIIASIHVCVIHFRTTNSVSVHRIVESVLMSIEIHSVSHIWTILGTYVDPHTILADQTARLGVSMWYGALSQSAFSLKCYSPSLQHIYM
jgi:hypothetical protein